MVTSKEMNANLTVGSGIKDRLGNLDVSAHPQSCFSAAEGLTMNKI